MHSFTQHSSNSLSSSIVDFKIPYESSIADHLSESQEQITYIKLKLGQAFSKLEREINHNSQIEAINEELTARLTQLEGIVALQREENAGLKQTMEAILKNRKIMQEQLDLLKKKKNGEREEEEKKNNYLENQFEEKCRELEKMEKKFKEQSEYVREIEEKLKETNKYAWELERRGEQMRQWMMGSNMNQFPTNFPSNAPFPINFPSNVPFPMNNCFNIPNMVPMNMYQQEGDSYNKENANSSNMHEGVRWGKAERQFSQMRQSRGGFNSGNQIDSKNNATAINSQNIPFNSGSHLAQLPESTVSPKESTVVLPKTDDQRLTECQQERRRTEQHLMKLEQIRRPSAEQRALMEELQKGIYSLDSTIAGLKRKIRAKY